MARIQLKLLVFLIALGVAAGFVAMAYWIYDNVLRHEFLVQEDIKNKQRGTYAPPDPGAKRFDAAVDLIRAGQIDPGREALFNLLQKFPESPTCLEARRIIGEMNLDVLFSPNNLAGKKDYIVQPGDSLALIATKNSTNVDMLIRMNGLMGTTLHPGDHLLVVPLEFDVVVDVSAKSVTLLRKERFFKEYIAFDVKLPSGARIPLEIQVGVKQAVIDGKAIAPTDPRYPYAEKSVPASKPGFIFRTIPIAKAIVISDDEARSKKAVPVNPALAPEPPPEPESGIFMAKEDLEEFFALVRKGSKLTIVR